MVPQAKGWSQTVTASHFQVSNIQLFTSFLNYNSSGDSIVRTLRRFHQRHANFCLSCARGKYQAEHAPFSNLALDFDPPSERVSQFLAKTDAMGWSG